MRLDRYLTFCDLGTRKQVKELISKGRISIDGKTVKDAGAAVKGEVKLDGKQVSYRPVVVIVMNKPAGVLTATTDKRQGTVLDLLPEKDRRREPAPVGRLDKDTTGLLFITDDGQAAHALISPKSGVDKRYRALLDAPVTAEDVEALPRDYPCRILRRCRRSWSRARAVWPTVRSRKANSTRSSGCLPPGGKPSWSCTESVWAVTGCRMTSLPGNSDTWIWRPGTVCGPKPASAPGKTKTEEGTV